MSDKSKPKQGTQTVEASKGLTLIRFKEFLQNFHDTDQYSSDRSFCFIIGSGAAATAKIPSGLSLVNRWLVELHDMDDGAEKRLLPPHAEIETYADALLEGEVERLKMWSEKRFAGLKDYTFADRARFYGQIYKARFESEPVLGQQFLRTLIHQRKPSIGYHLLARILNRTRHNVVITTNFDRLVEDSIAITEKEAVQSYGHTELAAFVQSRPKHPVVAKIHGDIMLQTYNATEELEKLDEHWKVSLKSLFLTYTPIVIGYGGNDPGFMRFLLDEMKTWDPERRCYWFVRKARRFDRIPYCVELADVKALRVVECPGFTELMLKLNEIFNLKPLHEELQDQAKIIAAELREAENKALGEMAEHERKQKDALLNNDGAGESKNASASAAIAQLPELEKRTWRDWCAALINCPNSGERTKVLKQALQELPDNFPIQAAAAVQDLEEKPQDDAPLISIQRWLKESEVSFGPESDETLAVMHSLARALYSTNEFEKAESLLRRVIAARDRVLGPDHPDTLMSRNALAIVLRDQGKYAEAEKEHCAVLALRKCILGVDHPDTLTSRSNLAIALSSQGKIDEAEQEHRVVLDLREQVLGPEHCTVFQSCFNLGVILMERNQFAEALAYIKRAEAGFQKVVGPEHLHFKKSNFIRVVIEAKMNEGK